MTGVEGLSGISGLDYWTGILEWAKLLLKAFFLIGQLSRKWLRRMPKQGMGQVSEVTE